LVKTYGISPEKLRVEITETVMMTDAENRLKMLDRLRKDGFIIEMDDFGSGYSSLNMISEMPVDVIKLDMQFIQSAFRENHDTRVVEAAIRIAESLYVPTVAEGVETEEQLIALKAMGCDIAQGYYFSKPLPVEEYEVFIEKWMKTDVSFNPIELSHGGPCLTDRQVRRMSLYDSLTGLYNYSAFELLIRDADRYHTALLIAYVNEVRSILHSQGERVVDELLRSITALLRQYFRTGDQICRISTYEFAVIMTRVDSSIQSQVIEKINRINEALLLGGGEIPPASLSVGVAFADRKHPEGDLRRRGNCACIFRDYPL
jgi:diguanylate cyclase (GGDEF)-like protein